MAGPLVSSHARQQVTAALRSKTPRIILGYAIIGFANVILPSIIFSSCYLLIPFPRPIVALILLLPSLLTKAIFPHILPYIPWNIRPLLQAILWAIATIIAVVSPPNVPPLIRFPSSMLACVAASLAEVSCLGHLRHFGQPGLAGWGIGTGAAATLWAVLPYFLTTNMGIMLRALLHYVAYLVAAMTVAHYLLLGRPPVPTTTSKGSDIKFDDMAAEEGTTFSLLEPTSRPTSFRGRIKHNLLLTDKLARPHIRQLLYTFTLQALVAPGLGRAYAKSSAFETFDSFYALYNVAFHAGSFIARSMIVFNRFQKLRNITSVLTGVTAVLVINGVFAATSSPVLILPLEFVAGFLGGAVYVNVFATAVSQTASEDAPDAEYALGVIGVGETAGVLLGELFGSLLELSLCMVDRGTGLRWCYSESAM